MTELEKAAVGWAFQYVEDKDDVFAQTDCENGFIAGARWQKEQSEQRNRDDMFAASLIGAKLAKPKWISVKDKLPEPGKKVLILTRNGKVSMSYRSYSRDGHGNILKGKEPDWSGSYMFVDSITHWMPIPEPPKGGKE